ncbi:MAG: efflux RND transporter periplasmic adaptor subunit [Rhodospirillaceae bacterium]
MKATFLISAALIGAAAAGCSQAEAPKEAAGSPMPVSVAAAAEHELVTPFEAGGVIRAQRVAVIVSRIMGDVRAVPVKAGDRVRAGQALVLLDARELQAHRERATAGKAAVTQATALAEADRQAAEAGLALARLTHQRIADLKAKNSATQGELDEAVANLRAAEARMKVAEARVAEARASIDSATAGASAADVMASYATLTAPFDGVVTEKNVDPGNMASPGQPLVTVEDDRTFRLEVRLDESRAALVHVGDEVRASFDDGASNVVGRVAEVERMLNSGSHDFLVKIDLPPGTPLRSGMYGRATLRGAARTGLAVPEASVLRRGQLFSVFVVEADNRARLRLVNASEPADGWVEIRAGLRSGERVVLSPPPALVDGSPVIAGPAPAGSGR